MLEFVLIILFVGMLLPRGYDLILRLFWEIGRNIPLVVLAFLTVMFLLFGGAIH